MWRRRNWRCTRRAGERGDRLWVLNGVGGAWVHAAFAPTGYIGRVNDMVVFDEDGPGSGTATLFLTQYETGTPTSRSAISACEL
jgi:hypothetical protein